MTGLDGKSRGGHSSNYWLHGSILRALSWLFTNGQDLTPTKSSYKRDRIRMWIYFLKLGDSSFTSSDGETVETGQSIDNETGFFSKYAGFFSYLHTKRDRIQM